MKTILLVGLAVLLLAGTACSQKKSILEWYAIADSTASFPPVDEQLSMASQKVDQWYVTFFGIKNQPKVLLAAITTSAITDVKSISLSVQFNKIKPSAGKITTWGYVFDRNGDGKIDYMELLSGAAAYEGDEFPADFPEGRQPLNKEQQSYFIGHCKLIFEHWADDNYDGKFDAVVQNDLDPKRDLVMQQILVRSTTFTNIFDDVWGFRGNIRGDRDSVPHSEKRVPCRTIGKRNDAITPKVFMEKNAILDLVNRAGKALKLTEENFYHPEEREE